MPNVLCRQMLHPKPEDYRLGPGDQVVVRVVNMDEIQDTPYSVDAQGYLHLPVAGDLQVVGMTTCYCCGYGRRRKMGFAVPVGKWMQQEHRRFVESTLLSPTALKRGYFRPELLRTLVSEHLAATEDNSQQLWSLLWLELWHQMFVD